MFCVTNVILSLLYYDADYQNKKDISSLCLKITDFMSVMQSIFDIDISIRYSCAVPDIGELIKKSKNFRRIIRTIQFRQNTKNTTIDLFTPHPTILIF